MTRIEVIDKTLARWKRNQAAGIWQVCSVSLCPLCTDAAVRAGRNSNHCRYCVFMRVFGKSCHGLQGKPEYMIAALEIIKLCYERKASVDAHSRPDSGGRGCGGGPDG